MIPSRLAGAAGVALSLLAWTQAGAADGRARPVRLKLAAKPVRVALIDLALQADLSLGGDLEQCRGDSASFSGLMTPRAALARILAGSNCEFEWADRGTVVIRIRPRRPSPATESRQAPPSPAQALGEVVVTASREANLPGRTPFALSVASPGALAVGRVDDLGDLAGQVAGMTVTNLGPGRDKIMLRGVSDGAYTGQTQSTVALYLDNVPITYSAPDPGLRLADLERVEILRGPQGTLYGGGAIGGVARLLTRKPDLDRFTTRVVAGASSTRGGGANTEVEAVLNVPVIAGRLALRGVAYDERADGYVANASLGLDAVNASRRRGARLAARLELAADWTLSAGLASQSIRTDDTQYGLGRLGPRERDNRVREPHHNSFDQGSLTLAGEGGWGRTMLTASQVGHVFTSRYDASAAAGLYGLPAAPTAFDETREIDLTTIEAAYATPGEGRLRGLVGAFFSNGHVDLTTALGAVTSRGGVDGPSVYGEVRADRIREAALYGEATYDLGERLSLTAGLRVFQYSFDTDSRVEDGGLAGRFEGRGRDRGVSPKILLAYRPNATTLFYLQAAEGYRPGGFNTAGRLGQWTAAGAQDRRYDADGLVNLEAGFKVRALDERLQIRAATFVAFWTDIQSDQRLADGQAYVGNVGSAQIRGVEIEAAWRVNDRLDLRAAAMLNDPSLTRRGGRGTDLPVALAGVSSLSANFGLDYRRPVAAVGTAHLRVDGRLVGRDRTALDPGDGASLPAYAILNLSAGIARGPLTLTAFVDNVADSHANTFAYGNPFLPTSETVITSARPRTVGLKLTAAF